MQQPQAMQRAIDDDAPFDQQSAERHRIVRAVAGKLQRPVEQQMRPRAVGRFDGERIARRAGDIEAIASA